MSGELYHWKYFTNNKFEVSSDLDSTINNYNISYDVILDTPFYEFCKSFTIGYTSFEIPSGIESKLDELLVKYNQEDLKPLLLITGIALQKAYSDNFEFDKKDDLLNDFNNQYLEFRELLEKLQTYLFNDNKNNLPDISFKPFTEPTITLKNFFVKLDIYDALCKGFGLTKENFEQRSNELLEPNKLKIDKFAEKVKFDFFHILYEYLIQEKELKRADALKFIGNYFLFFQIRIKKDSTEIELYQDINDNLEDSDIKNLNHYLTRPPKFHHF